MKLEDYFDMLQKLAEQQKSYPPKQTRNAPIAKQDVQKQSETENS